MDLSIIIHSCLFACCCLASNDLQFVYNKILHNLFLIYKAYVSYWFLPWTLAVINLEWIFNSLVIDNVSFDWLLIKNCWLCTSKISISILSNVWLYHFVKKILIWFNPILIDGIKIRIYLQLFLTFYLILILISNITLISF